MGLSNYKNIFIYFLIAASVLFIFLNVDWSKNIIYKISYPVFKFFNWLSIKPLDAFDYIKHQINTSGENERLKKENEELLTERTVFKEIAEENKSLRKALGLNMPKEERLLLTDIVGYGSQNIGQYVFIDKGRADGLKNGLMVIGGNGGLIGKIIEADDHFSKVLLITDYASNINAVVQNTERSQGLVKGQHGLTLVMEMLPLEDKIEVGQSVVSVGSVDLSPPGLLIGRVQKVILRENDVFQKALIGPAVDFRRLEKAFVVIIN